MQQIKTLDKQQEKLTQYHLFKEIKSRIFKTHRKNKKNKKKEKDSIKMLE